MFIVFVENYSGKKYRFSYLTLKKLSWSKTSRKNLVFKAVIFVTKLSSCFSNAEFSLASVNPNINVLAPEIWLRWWLLRLWLLNGRKEQLRPGRGKNKKHTCAKERYQFILEKKRNKEKECRKTNRAKKSFFSDV